MINSKKNSIGIQLFQTPKIIYQGHESDLIHKLGKKIISLFEVFVINAGEAVSSDYLIDNIWPDSEDGRNVLKYSIFRLRKALSDIEGLEGLELIKTVEDGYILNPAYDYDIDVKKAENIYKKLGRKMDYDGNDYNLGRELVKLYKGHFYVTNNAPLVLTLDSERHSSHFSNIVVSMSKYLLANHLYTEMMSLNYNAIMFETFYEGLHYYYMKGLIEVKDYHRALQYYDEINERFYNELGTGLSQQFKDLYNVIVEDDREKEKTELSALRNDIEQNIKLAGGFYCTYDMFKHLYEITTKECKREDKRCFLLMFSISDNIDYSKRMTISNKLKKIIEESIRTSDVFARVNKDQFVSLLVCREMDNVYMIAQRISAKFYKKYSSAKVRLNYSAMEVTPE